MDVEVGEQDDKGDGIAYARVVHPLGKVAVNVQGVCSMDDGHGELELQYFKEKKKKKKKRAFKASELTTEAIKKTY